jgi:hypothetical protein
MSNPSKITIAGHREPCEFVKGKAPGPAHIQWCKTHGHVVDTKSKKVLAKTLDEFKKMKF